MRRKLLHHITDLFFQIRNMVDHEEELDQIDS
jgi:hypothetical protein